MGWSLFDQILVHFSLADKLESVKILENAGDAKLLTPSGIPDKKISDHLPLLINFKN